MKSRKVALLLCTFLGGLGVHRFYVGKIGTGILWLFTFGLFGFGTFIDFICLCVNSFKDKDGCELENDVSPIVIGLIIAAVVFLFIFGVFSGLFSVAEKVVQEDSKPIVVEDSKLKEDLKELEKVQKELEDLQKELEKVDEEVSIPKEVETPKSEVNKSYIPVTVAQLYEEMETNELRTERKYQDNYVEVSGYLMSMDSDGEYFTVKAEKSDWCFYTVHCDITSDEQIDVLLNKNKNDAITVRGEMTIVGEVIGFSMDVHSIK